MSDKTSVTPAIRALRAANVSFEEHLYRYEEKGGTAVSARELGVEEERIVKTIVLEDERRQPLIVLMNGDKEISTKGLARLTGAKTITPCKPEVANKHTGYMVGGTSPFGTKKILPIYMEKRILDFDKVYINGGKRGFLVAIDPAEIARVLSPTIVEIGV